MKLRKKLILIILFVFLSFGCTKTISYDTERINTWIEDIEEVEMMITNCHPDPYRYISKDEFKSLSNTLKDNIFKMNDHEIAVQLSMITAKMKDMHTRIILNNMLMYPFKARYFGDELYIIETTEEYKNILLKKVIEIEGQSIDIIEEKVGEVCTFENDIGKQWVTSRQLSSASTLFGLKIVKDLENIDLTLEDEKGNVENITVKSIEDMMYGESKIIDVNSCCESPMYMKNNDIAYSFEYLQENDAIYFDCNNFDDHDIRYFLEKLFAEIDSKSPEKLIIDVRNNSGGEGNVEQAFKNKFDYYKNNNGLDNCTIYIVTNNNTYSAEVLATAYAVNNLNAIMIGESPAQPFRFFAGQRICKSKNSKLMYGFSSSECGTGEELKVIEPDIYIPLSIEEYKRGEDPVMEYILTK